MFNKFYGVDVLAQFVQAEQLNQVGGHAIGLLNDRTQTVKRRDISLLAALHRDFFQRADLHVQRIFHVMDRRCYQVVKADVVVWHVMRLPSCADARPVSTINGRLK